MSISACTSSVQLVDTEIPLPAVRVDTVRVVETERVFVEAPCDTGAILDALCKGEVSGTTDGVEWRIRYEKVAREAYVLGTKVRRLADSVNVLAKRPATTMQLPESVKEQIGKLEVNQEQHTWYELYGGGLAMLLAGLLIGFLVSKFT